LEFPFPAARPKFRHRYWVHILWFVATLITTTWVGFYGQYAGFRLSLGTASIRDVQQMHWYLYGLIYSAPMLLILGAHEFGHYFYCRKHDVDASLPYFMPAPLPLTGTVGAVIRIREPFPSIKALFDIGVAGPIAGFIMLLPFLYWGVTLSAVARLPPSNDVIYFGEPLLFKLMSYLHFGTLPQGFDIILHPMGFAAWFGMLATAMNLLPFGQLDGGHISYAVFGPRARFISMGTLAVTILLVLRSFSWVSMAVIMLAMAFFLGLRHPSVMDEGAPLDSNRKWIAVLALVIFVLCFTPVPIQTFFKGT
jgi:membrane-associated protease RseP (regulator of RpoE activity)